MGIYINSASISSSDGQSFTVANTAGNTIFSQGLNTYSGNTFAYFDHTRPGFIAVANNDNWVVYSAGSWHKVNTPCNVSTYNVGIHYDTSTTRFNVPITGPYLFIWSAYQYCAGGGYAHPEFAVNGSVGTRRGNSGYPVRIREHGYVTGGYSHDACSSEVIECQASDYVEVYQYAGSTNTHIYQSYNHFAGVFVG